jgi:YbbR domain-containing protein
MRFIRPRRLALMLVSALLAAGLWLLVAGEQTVERNMRIPLEFTNLPSHLELAGDAPETVDVRVRGASASLSSLTTGDLTAVLDLRQARAGQRLFHLRGSDVRAPLSVEIVQVQPSSVAMTFEPSETKIVPVSPRVEGQPAAGFRIGAISSQPATVVVAGPSTAVRRMTEAITEPVSVTGALSPVTEVVTVGVVDPTIRVQTTQSVRVTVEVMRAP